MFIGLGSTCFCHRQPWLRMGPGCVYALVEWFQLLVRRRILGVHARVEELILSCAAKSAATSLPNRLGVRAYTWKVQHSQAMSMVCKEVDGAPYLCFILRWHKRDESGSARCSWT